jgi:hypothetical protein
LDRQLLSGIGDSRNSGQWQVGSIQPPEGWRHEVSHAWHYRPFRLRHAFEIAHNPTAAQPDTSTARLIERPLQPRGAQRFA